MHLHACMHNFIHRIVLHACMLPSIQMYIDARMHKINEREGGGGLFMCTYVVYTVINTCIYGPMHKFAGAAVSL